MAKRRQGFARRVVSIVSAVALSLSLCPIGQAFANEQGGGQPDEPAQLQSEEQTPASETPQINADYYVTATDNAETPQDITFNSLVNAIDNANSSNKPEIVICVIGEVTASSCARITDIAGVDKHVRIVGIDDASGNPAKVTRSETFSPITDTARETYNPALIEVTSPKGKNVTLTLENITLDDNFLYEGNVFNQASSGGDTSGNANCVQDAIVAGYGINYSNPNVKIILGDDAVLQNFGGMSAVRVTGGASLEMKSGSLITDTTSHDRTKFNNIPDDGIEDDNGAAGAVWVQGTEATMDNGATIDSVKGRAFYVDVQGSVHAAGTVSDMEADADMWWGLGGVVAHVRDGSKLELQNGFLVSGGSGQDGNNKGSAFYVVQADSQLTMQDGAKVTGWSNGNIVLVEHTNRLNASDDNQQNSPNNAETYINGTICGNDIAGSHAVEATNGYVVIGEQAQIKKNKVNYGTVYIHGGNFVEIRGKIKDNYSTDRGGGVAMTNHGYSRVDMYDRAEITGNYSKETGGGVLVSEGLFCMHGGTISGNFATLEGGGIFVREKGILEMTGGDISGNYTATYGGGVAFQPGSSRVSIGGNAKVENNYSKATVIPDEKSGTCEAYGGTPNNFAVTRDDTNNYSSTNSYLVVSDSATTSSDDVCISHFPFSVDSLQRNTEIGSAAEKNETEAFKAYNDKGLSTVKGSFWYNVTSGAAEKFTISGIEHEHPLYAAVVATNEEGTPDGDFTLYSVEDAEGGTLSMTLPGQSANGYAVVLLEQEPDTVAIIPADITVYQGGNGYDAVVGGSETTTDNSMPHPLFKITGVENPENLEFTNGEKTWTVKEDGTGYYHFVPDKNQENVRVTYTDKTGKAVTSDLFKVSDVKETFAQFKIDLYPGENNLNNITVSNSDEPMASYKIVLGSGTLTVRAIQSAGEGVVTEVQSSAPTAPLQSGTATAVKPADDTVYTLNDTDVILPESEAKPSLLFDDIIEDSAESTARTDALAEKADKELGAVDSNATRHYEIKYLDLVDANNSNAWIKSSKGTDIYWGYPEGTDKYTTFHVLHFEGLHRDGASSGYDLSDIESSKVTQLTAADDGLEQTDYGIKFHVEKGGFSPFALVWETDAGSGGVVTPPSPQKVTLHYETNGGRDLPDEQYVVGSKADLETPLREGCTFVGWYMDEALTVPAEDPLVMDSDKTVWAKWESTEVPEGFTPDHVNYILGRDTDDGYFIAPEANITRAEVATMFYRLLDDETRSEYRREASTFPDVEHGAWYETAVATMQAMGILRGDEGTGTCRPNDPITRAEFAAMAGRFDDDGEWPDMEPFSDMEGHWAERIVLVAAKNGWILGDEGSDRFRPDDPITRAEAITVTNRVLQRIPESESDLLPGRVEWPDNQNEDAWYWLAVEEATNNHDHTVKSDGVHEKWTALVENEDWAE